MTRNRRLAIAAVIAVAAGGFILAFASSPENRMALTSAAGTKTEGEMFDVRIGARPTNLNTTLAKHGFRFYSVLKKSETCGAHVYPPDRHVELYVDESWRKGSVCVAELSEGTVTEVDWSYAAFMIDL